MNEGELEDELLAVLAMIKRQKTQLDEQHQVVTTAIADLGKERARWMTLLQDFRDFPKQATESLEWATGDAIKKSLHVAIAEQRKSLHGAVNAATSRLDEARDRTAAAAITWGLIGALLGGSLVGGGMWYAVASGAIKQTVMISDPAGIAAALGPYLAVPAPARKR